MLVWFRQASVHPMRFDELLAIVQEVDVRATVREASRLRGERAVALGEYKAAKAKLVAIDERLVPLMEKLRPFLDATPEGATAAAPRSQNSSPPPNLFV